MTQSDKHYAEQIVATISQPIVILTGELKVEIVNRAFCHAFKVKDGEAEGRLLSELGNGEWDIPELRRLLHEVLSKNNEVTDYRVEHTFERTGRKIMCLNARRMPRADSRDRILLAIDDIPRSRNSVTNSKEARNSPKSSSTASGKVFSFLAGICACTRRTSPSTIISRSPARRPREN